MGVLIERVECCESDVLDFAHTAATTAWTPICVPGLGVLIPRTTKVAGVKNSFARSGRYTAPIADSVAISKGNSVYYDSAADKVQTDIPAAGFFLGIAADNGTATAGYVDVLVNVKPRNKKTIITTVADGAATYTAAQVLGGAFKSTPTAARAHTLPTAAQLKAALPDAEVGTEVEFTIDNLAAATHAITLTDSASITNGGIAAHAVVAAATAATFKIVFTNVTADSEAATWILK